MPIYIYECPSCECELEILQSVKEHEDKTMSCPKCGRDMEPVLGPTTFILRGVGWTPRSN